MWTQNALKVKVFSLFVLLLTGFVSAQTMKTLPNSSQKMKTKTSTLRLVYPQWQGGVVTALLPELPAEDSSRGYYLGAHLLNFLSPENGQKTAEVPVSLEVNDRAIINGVNSHSALVKQAKAALDILDKENPGRIVTLGGDCAVSVVPFTYMAAKYPDDVAIVWMDAHPDINLPGDTYEGYHAMALTACLGMGDRELTGMLPVQFKPAQALLVGLRSWDTGMKDRQGKLGIKGLSPHEVAGDSSAVLEWLKATGVSKVVIHFDLDVLDPAEIIAAVGTGPNGMKIETAVRLVQDISSQYDVVALTVAEPMPRVAIKIRNMLRQLPLLKG